MTTQQFPFVPRARRGALPTVGSLALLALLTGPIVRLPMRSAFAGGPTSLSTTFAAGNRQPGNMFDVHSLETIRIEDLSCNIDAPATTPVSYRIYSRVGSYEFKMHSSHLWTLSAYGTALSSGEDTPTRLGANLNLVLPPGQVTGMYVTLTSGHLRCTPSPTQYGVAAANGDLAILEGIGIKYPFGAVQEKQTWNGTLHYSIVAGTPFCLGDASGGACPCGNYSHGPAGCQNGSGRGALLQSCGNPSIAAAELAFTVTDLPAHGPALLLSGTLMVNGGLGAFYGDGLACLAGTVRQYGVQTSGPQGVAHWDAMAIAHGGGVQLGNTLYYQVLFRDPTQLGPCGSLVNLSNGFAVTFEP